MKTSSSAIRQPLDWDSPTTLQPAAREGFGSPDSDSGWVTSNPPVVCRPGRLGRSWVALVWGGLLSFMPYHGITRTRWVIDIAATLVSGQVSRVGGALARPMLSGSVSILDPIVAVQRLSALMCPCVACATRSFSPEPAGWFCRVLRFLWSCARAATRS